MESPASVAVIGGGPIGIEAAIYARFLGYFVSIFEAKRVGHRMLDWHHRPLGIAAGEITTPLGCAAIRAQDPEYTLPNSDRIMTGQEYADEYLLPLAKSDLLFDDIHFLSPVVDIARVRTSRNDPVLWQERCNDEFRIVVQGRHRGTWIARADCIIDCRGDAIDSSGMGPGGGLGIANLNARNWRESIWHWSVKALRRALLRRISCASFLGMIPRKTRPVSRGSSALEGIMNRSCSLVQLHPFGRIHLET